MSAATAEPKETQRRELCRQLCDLNKTMTENSDEQDAIDKLYCEAEVKQDVLHARLTKLQNEYNLLKKQREEIVKKLLTLRDGDKPLGGFKNFFQSNPTLKF